MENINDKKYLTKFNTASFAMAGFGQNLIIGLVNGFLLFFYTDVFLLGAGAAGILMIVARIWDALNDPIMGTFVDKTNSRWGKMRPYLLATPIPLAISTALLFIVPNISFGWKVAYAYITYLAWGMIYTICDVPFWGLASVMTPNPKERISFISFSRLFHSVGGALPILLVPLFVKLFGGNEKGFLAIGISVGIFGGLLFSLSFFGTKERCKVEKNSSSLKESLRYLKINKPLMTVVLANVIGFTRAMPVVASMYIATYVLGDSSLNIIIVGGWGVAGYLGMILTPKICKKYNYRQIYYIAAVIGVLSCLLLLLLGKNIYAITICLTLCGFPYGVASNINYAMIADSVEYVEWKTGNRTEGITISLQTLMNKLMSAFQIGLVSLVLIIIHFVEPIKIGDKLFTQPQSPFALNGFFFTITVIPAIGWALSVIPMRFYSFIGAERQQAHIELGERRKAAFEKEEAQECPQAEAE
ncbi:MAG: glycoside-pentoside-hexuronide (GPH):cation symporter [Clostridia bacterium]|nr:glycoside-pentoside-hexuronide (GPH):cation symporter [Clostridia bacterium]